MTDEYRKSKRKVDKIKAKYDKSVKEHHKHNPLLEYDPNHYLPQDGDSEVIHVAPIWQEHIRF